jgi:hypothetical protein
MMQVIKARLRHFGYLHLSGGKKGDMIMTDKSHLQQQQLKQKPRTRKQPQMEILAQLS